MPVGNTTSRQNTRWFRIANGKFIEKVTADTPGAVRRMTKTNREVWETLYDKMVGCITDIALKEGQYEGRATKQWNFTVEDGKERFVITLNYDSSYAKSLINTLASVEDFTKVLCFSAWLMDEKKSPTGKPMSGLSVYLGDHPIKGGAIPKKFTREEMPKVVEVIIKGEKQYDDLELCKFLENLALNEIKPKFFAARADVDFDNLSEENELAAADADAPF
jgi:hypothetical protein